MYTYESEEHYLSDLGAAEQEQAGAYSEYLESLLDNKEYTLYALETCADKLSEKFPEAATFLRKEYEDILDRRRLAHEKAKEPKEEASDPGEDLPF